jgi:hypothetical protein
MANKTSLSVGEIIYKLLNENAEVKSKATAVFPIVVDKAELPYVAYRRSALEHNPVKVGNPGADTVTIQVLCFAADYDGSVQLAEAVREALDYKACKGDELSMRSCYLSGAEEYFDNDAYTQELSFTVKV